jgi:hypothetical protein
MDRDYEEGFYGEQFARFEESGEEAVLRLMCKGDILPQDRQAVLVWLGRKAKKKEFRSDLALVLSGIAIVISIISVIVAIIVAFR